MAALLLAGSAAYAALKWRTLLPALTTHLDNVINVPKWSAEPVVAALMTGAIAAYAVATEDELTSRTTVEEIAFATLASALGTLLWPQNDHWSMSALTLAAVLTAELVMRDATRWWAAATVGCVAAYLKIFQSSL